MITAVLPDIPEGHGEGEVAEKEVVCTEPVGKKGEIPRGMQRAHPARLGNE